MRVYIDVFRTQKAGNAESEYEDAFWQPKCQGAFHGDALRIAAADGATDSIFSGFWAYLLVRAYGRRRMDNSKFPEHVANLGRLWARIVRRRRPMPWYAEEKARSGAHAAFLGVELIQAPDSSAGNWSALACGDCCFFQLRAAEMITAFPVSCADDFSSTPLLLSSGGMTSNELGAVRTATGSWQEGDCLYLMTDALACWFLSTCEKGLVPWELLRDLTLAKTPPFESWVADLRLRHEIKNDDCTLVSVTFEHC